MDEVFNIQLTRAQIGTLYQVMVQAPYGQIAPIINQFLTQVQEQERAQQESSTSKANGGSGPQPSLFEEGGRTAERR